MSKDPNRLLIVMLLDEKIVGFACVNVLDDGKTLFHEGWRVNPEHRGKGVFKEFKVQRESLIQKHGFSSPRVVRERLSKKILDNTNVDAKLLHSLFCQFSVQRGKLDAIKNLRNIVESTRTDKVKPICKVDYKQMYEHILNFFPPRDLILLSWTAWDATLSNLKLLEAGRYRHRHASVEYWVGGWQEAGGNYGFGKSYSISCMSPVQSGHYYVITIHTKDWKQFCHHLFHHVQIFQQKGGDGDVVPTLLQVLFDVELQSRVMQLLFSETPSQSDLDDFFVEGVGIIENDYIPQAKM